MVVARGRKRAAAPARSAVIEEAKSDYWQTDRHRAPAEAISTISVNVPQRCGSTSRAGIVTARKRPQSSTDHFRRMDLKYAHPVARGPGGATGRPPGLPRRLCAPG